MNYHKFPAPANFFFPEDYRPISGSGRFLSEEGAITFERWSTGAFKVSMRLGEENDRQYDLTEIGGGTDGDAQAIGTDAAIVLRNGEWKLNVYPGEGLRFELLHQEEEVLTTPRSPFGLAGRRQMLLLDRDPGLPIYGLGEKTGGLNKNNRAWQFWNTDACADHPHTFGGDDFDPPYVSIPLMISRRGDSWFGILFHNPTRCTFQFNHDPSDKKNCFSASHGMRTGDNSPQGAMTSDMGQVDVYIIPGPTLSDVVRGIAALTGVHTLPPRWALGYHQCRWGYSSAREIREVADELAEASIPVAAMWMDIDYMDDFRVFTFHPEHFSPDDLEETRTRLHQRGTRLVTMIDPGVKADDEWEVYKDAVDGGHLCQSHAGTPYIGMVWPGRTAFPDFSRAETRGWWAARIARHLKLGIDGIWIDMNDPSTGLSDYTDMLFDYGTEPHAVYHNQYATQMAAATEEGFRLHDPNCRPFILTRSASTGIQRHAAVWTGDNVSNVTHLRQSIPMSLNLSLSGIAFNGPDVGGFAGDVTEELLVTWTLAGALFPFFRNHTSTGTRDQEPTRFSPKALEIIRACINTRCKLLPHLANLFHDHVRDGVPVMRPLAMEFPGVEFEDVDDVYMVGSHLLVVPFLDLEKEERTVNLPAGWWYDMRRKEWVRGGAEIVIPREDSMNLYIRDGAIIPCLAGSTFQPEDDFSNLELHVFLHGKADACLVYREEDGTTLDWEEGGFNEYEIVARKDGSGTIRVSHEGWRPAMKSIPMIHYDPGGGDDLKSGTAKWPFGNHSVRVRNLDVET
ncbi:MAG: hypothetical protein JJU11_07470 [Candidatus Sumerlaeia bacterium]|nr:hypothetical protein [Candidatus Sumerlaeia bacterium]